MTNDRDRSIAVQFYNINDIVDAYVDQGIPCFAIWHRKQLLFPMEPEDIDEGAAMLQDLLTKLKVNNSNATYTLCIYKDIPEKGIISNTPFRASFNFKLNNEEHYQNGIGYGHDSQAVKILQDQITALQLKNQQLEAELAEEGDDAGGDGMGQIGTLLNHPLVKLLTDRLVGGMMNNMTPQEPQQSRRPAVMNGIQQQTPAQRLEDALKVLNENDSNLVEHLYKLAVISESQPDYFKLIVGMLDNHKV